MEKSIDVLLIALLDEGNDPRKALPLALPVLKSVLSHRGYDVKSMEIDGLDISMDDFFGILKKHRPKIIGLSATAYELNALKRISRLIKSYSIEIPIMAGGYCSLIPNLAAITDIDVVVHGEGEITVLELVEIFKKPYFERFNPKLLRQIKGISFKDPEHPDRIIKTPPRDLIENLDSLPFPDFSDFDLKSYKGGEWIPLYTQRGCYNRCNFCDIIPFYGGVQKIRSMTPHQIVSWIKKAFSIYNTPYILFTDDNFMSSRKFLEEFIHEFKQQGLFGKVFINFQTRVNDIIRFEDLLDEFKGIIFSIELGVESFIDAQLSRFNKNTTSEQNLKAISILNEKGIPYSLYYMFLDKKTTLDELRSNVNTILSLKDIPVFGLSRCLPEVIVNYQYSALCDLYGTPTIEGIDFLEAFYYFLENTEDIRELFILYRVLVKYNELGGNTENAMIDDAPTDIGSDYLSDENTRRTDEIDNKEKKDDILLSLSRSLLKPIEDLGRKRLITALLLAEMVHSGKIKYFSNKKGINRKITRMVNKFNSEIYELLKPFKLLGIDLEDFSRNY